MVWCRLLSRHLHIEKLQLTQNQSTSCQVDLQQPHQLLVQSYWLQWLTCNFFLGNLSEGEGSSDKHDNSCHTSSMLDHLCLADPATNAATYKNRYSNMYRQFVINYWIHCTIVFIVHLLRKQNNVQWSRNASRMSLTWKWQKLPVQSSKCSRSKISMTL